MNEEGAAIMDTARETGDHGHQARFRGAHDASSRSAALCSRRRRPPRAGQGAALSANGQACLPGRSAERLADQDRRARWAAADPALAESARDDLSRHPGCLLYTSDAADEE